MQFEKVNNNKIKIILSTEDIILNNLCLDNDFNKNPFPEQFLQDILYKAEKEINFKTEDNKLLIEIFKHSKDIIIFSITKFDDHNINFHLIFEFKNFEDFLSLCTYLNNMLLWDVKNLFSETSLALYNNTYYLIIPNSCNFPLTLFNILNEFGKYTNYSPYLSGRINEYGKILFKDNAILEGIKII